MAKDRHRFFEIYESRDEAAWEVMPKAYGAAHCVGESETCDYKQLSVSQLAGLMQVQFKEAELAAENVVIQIGNDLANLANKLAGDSRVIVDFTGVRSFSESGINALKVFAKKLTIRGSRMVVCCLAPSVRTTFFTQH